MMENDHEDLGKAIEQLFNPKEPVALGTAASMAVTGTLSYLSFYGFVDNDAIGAVAGLLTLWLPVIGFVLRSQYTPFANQGNS
ncbi:MAG: hypothetical protein AB7V46_00380 [Thermomicrobiales bacterium]